MYMHVRNEIQELWEDYTEVLYKADQQSVQRLPCAKSLRSSSVGASPSRPVVRGVHSPTRSSGGIQRSNASSGPMIQPSSMRLTRSRRSKVSVVEGKRRSGCARACPGLDEKETDADGESGLSSQGSKAANLLATKVVSHNRTVRS